MWVKLYIYLELNICNIDEEFKVELSFSGIFTKYVDCSSE